MANGFEIRVHRFGEISDLLSLRVGLNSNF